MDYTRLLGAAETAVPILVLIAFSLQRWKTGMRDVWHEEAAAQHARADRLAEDVKNLLVEVSKLRAENAELRAQVAELLNR
ncbi:hypothetical protein [Streptomyces sp. A1-5]|uniref:hypothetical protein n=1 Tax=Streptomyces sp. A1-5 TaxID=2738410 RepID=UPI001F2F7172|nr:hypothetical protein [Streptomyces sp. A1-5]UJB43608.1 hypothetical protein HRD51_24930 [Streptomyces sp. A1-5]